jgi:hypothetical protein
VTTDTAALALREQLDADAITWELPTVPRLEDVPAADLLTLDPVALLAYVANAREDLRAVRLVLHEAVALLARYQDQLQRAARTIESLRRELRDRHEGRAA